MAEVTKGVSIEQNKSPIYNPDKNYGWTPEDSFTLSGNEFGAIYQAFKSDIYLPGGISIDQKYKAFLILEDIMRVAVSAGVAIEIIPPTPQESPQGVSITELN